MAIFQKAYQGYDGDLTAPFQRTFVIFRYALADVFQSRRFTAFFAICFLPSLLLLCLIYGYYNLELLIQMDIPIDDLLAIDSNFFALFMQIPQMLMIFVIVMVIGPTMISPDLRNNAMPLFLSRPISKANYIFGKLLVLLFLGSLISWVPGLILIFLQVYLGEEGWLARNLFLPFAAVFVSIAWIVSLSLLAFAVSACVKWKAVSRLFFFAIVMLGSVLGELIQQIFGSWYGFALNLIAAMEVMVISMFNANNMPLDFGEQMPAWASGAVLLSVSLIAGFVLTKRIRAYQVVS